MKASIGKAPSLHLFHAHYS